MSKLQELINRLCPNGVEFKPLGEVCEIKRGIRVVKNELKTEGTIPVYQNSLVPLGFYTKSNVKAFSTYIIAAGAAGDIGFSMIPYWGADDCYSIICNDTLIDKYVYYILDNNKILIKSKVRKASIPRLSKKDIEQLIIPVPPIEVQQEIVNILDRFANYAAELQEKLQAELQARKEQYEYYRNLLLTFNPSACGCGTDDEQKNNVTTWGGRSYKISWKTMGEIMSISRGASPRPIQSFLTESESGVPWIKIGDISPDSKYVISTAQKITKDGALKSKFLKKGDFILSNSMSFGRPYILGIDGCIHDGWVSLQDYQESFLPDFLYHILKADFIQSFWQKNAGQGGAVSNLNADIIRKTPIPIPPLELQEKIVAILDRFETLVNDISKGLPAEIAAVKARYEYYRNKLLTFKPLPA